MKIGDLVRINDLNEHDPRRMIGTIVRHDIYDLQYYKTREKISEVLWNGGHLGWVLASRLSVVSDIETDC